jgi:hypothetical protein
MLVVGITNWEAYIANAFKHLKPGAYFEHQDVCFPPLCDDGTAGPDNAMMIWSDLMLRGSANLGRDLGVTVKLPKMLREAGFVDIEYESRVWPFPDWPLDPQQKKVGFMAADNVSKALRGLTTAFLTKGLNMTPEATEQVVVNAFREFWNRKTHLYAAVNFVWARKPEVHEAA